jgi:hypothetical protein
MAEKFIIEEKILRAANIEQMDISKSISGLNNEKLKIFITFFPVL